MIRLLDNLHVGTATYHPIRFRHHPSVSIYKPVSYIPDSSAVERILLSEVSVLFTYYTLYCLYSFSMLQHLELVSEFQTTSIAYSRQSSQTYSL